MTDNQKKLEVTIDPKIIDKAFDESGFVEFEPDKIPVHKFASIIGQILKETTSDAPINLRNRITLDVMRVLGTTEIIYEHESDNDNPDFKNKTPEEIVVLKRKAVFRYAVLKALKQFLDFDSGTDTLIRKLDSMNS